MLRRLMIGLLTGFLVVLAGPSALAAPPTTTTETERGVVETFVDIFPSCDEGSPLYTITTTSNRIFHETLFDDGRVHATFTDTGTFSAEPLDPSMPSYTGKFTVWGGFNQSASSANGTFTFNVRGTGSDGSTFSHHSVEHFNELPDGTTRKFFHCH
ncbi:hypothetical protein Q9R29_01235 [Rothia sp. ARF10]|nr:hypothetical protein [Rothia sp. ARF10]